METRFHVTCGNCGREYACDEYVRDAAARTTCPDCGESYAGEIRAASLDGMEEATILEHAASVDWTSVDDGAREAFARIEARRTMIFALPPKSTDEIVARIARDVDGIS